MLIKQKYNTLLLFISISLTSCSSVIYQSFEEPILTENRFIIDNNSVSNTPIRFLVEPKPNNKVFGIPVGLYVYKLSSEKPDEKFNEWFFSMKIIFQTHHLIKRPLNIRLKDLSAKVF